MWRSLMSTFKVGDEVICRTNIGFIERFHLPKDQVFIVSWVSLTGQSIKLTEKGPFTFTSSRFILANPSTIPSMVCRKIQSMEKRFKERHVYN